MDKVKQISYWINSAEEDLSTALLLISNNKILHGLFFCHLCIEKTLKAHVVLSTEGIPPKIHNLYRLLEICKLSFNDEDMKLLDYLMIYQLEGRYPDNYPDIPSRSTTQKLYEQTKELFLCLKEKLIEL